MAAEAAIIQDSAGCWPDQSSHPLCFWRIKRSAPSGRHYQGGPDFGRGLFFVWRLHSRPDNRSRSAAQPSHRRSPNPPKSATRSLSNLRCHFFQFPRPNYPKSATHNTDSAMRIKKRPGPEPRLRFGQGRPAQVAIKWQENLIAFEPSVNSKRPSASGVDLHQRSRYSLRRQRQKPIRSAAIIVVSHKTRTFDLVNNRRAIAESW